MDFNELDEVMREYVASTNGSVEKDFAKLDSGKFKEVKAKAKTKRMHNRIWACVATMVVLIVALSVALPLTLNNNSSEMPSIFYFDYENVQKEDLDSIQDIRTELSQNVYLTKLSYDNGKIVSLVSETKTIGVNYNLYVFDELIDDIKAYILYDNVVLNSVSEYNTLPDSHVWDNIVVNYTKANNMMFDTVTYKFKFNANGFNHYYTITAVADVEIGELLDWVF